MYTGNMHSEIEKISESHKTIPLCKKLKFETTTLFTVYLSPQRQMRNALNFPVGKYIFELGHVGHGIVFKPDL